MTAEQGITALITLATSFVGAGAGAIIVLAFARRSALNQAMGQQFALRRIELIESLAKVLGQVASTMDAVQGFDQSPDYGRSYKELATEFAVLMDRADLFLSQGLIKALRPYHDWMLDNRDPLVQPGGYQELRRLLGEAIQGKHQPGAKWL